MGDYQLLVSDKGYCINMSDIKSDNGTFPQFILDPASFNPSGSGGGGHIVPANFWKAHRAKILIHNILFFGVTFSFYMWTT